MADNKEEIDINVKVTVEGDKAVKSIGDLKKEIRDLESQMVEYSGVNQKAFDEAAAKAGQLKDKINDIKSATKTLSGEPIENLGKSFAGLGQSIKNLDIEGFKNNFGALKTSIGDLGGSVMNGLRTSLSTTAGSFKLLGGAIAATGIGALVLIVVGLITHFDELSKSGGMIGKTFTYIGDMVARASQFLKDFLDSLGLTDFKGTELHEKQVKQAKELGEEKEKQAKKDKELSDEKEKRDQKAHEDYLKKVEEKKKADQDYLAAIDKLEDDLYLTKRDRLQKEYQDKIDFLEKGKELNINYYSDIKTITAQGQAALDAFDQDILNKKVIAEEAAKAKKAADDQLAVDMIKANRDIDLQLYSDYKLTQEQVDSAFEEAQRRNASITYAQFNEEYRKDNKTLKQKYDEDAKNAKTAQDNKNSQIRAGFSLAQSLTGAISAIGELVAAAQSRRGKQGYKESVEIARKQFNLAKGLQIVNAGIQTAQAVIAAYSSGAAVPIAGVALGPIMAAIAGIAGAAQIAAIAAKKFNPESPPTSDSGAAPVQNSGNDIAAAIPSASAGTGPVTAAFQASSFFGLGQNNLLGGDKDQKVFVVESDITNTQNRVRTIENRATLGG